MALQPLIGQDVPRIDALDKVTGAARYIDDLAFPGMLHARVLRSDRPHALIRRIDTSAAQAVSGVRAVVTGADFPFNVGIYMVDQYIFAMDRVRWVGEPVAAVAAATPQAAEEAVRRIRVEYEDLPALLDVEEAARPGALLIHPNIGSYGHVSAIHPRPESNVANHFKVRKGDPDGAMAQAHLVVENRFVVPQVQHVPLEPHGAIAQQDPTGRVTVWSSAQSPFTVRNLLSHCFGMKLHEIRCIAPYVGGGFGCKAGINLEPIAVALAMAAGGRPVKLIASREEEFHALVVRQGLRARLKTGLARDGRILAEEIELLWDCGAYAGYGVNIVRAAGYSIAGAYHVPNLRGDSLGIYTNRPVGSAYRGFGMQELHWAVEGQMDLCARALGLDPLQFRLINGLKPGATTATGELVTEHTGRLDLCLEAVAAEIGWHEPAPAPTRPGGKRARGIACAMKAPAMPNNAASAATIRFNEDGTCNLLFSGMEIGQGVGTVLAQIAADTLGIGFDQVRVMGLPDTDLHPYEWQTVASRITYSTGNAVRQAALRCREQICAIAAQALGCDPQEITIEGRLAVDGKSGRAIPLEKVVLGFQRPDGSTVGGAVAACGTFITEGLINLDPETGQSPKPVANWTFGAQAVDVEVDPETGELIVHKVAAAYDVGKVINAGTIRGQLYGGIVQGLSAGLLEELQVDGQGRVANDSLTDYKIATVRDIPGEMTAKFVETPQPDGPFGARGVGEHTMIPTPAAIANAIHEATGVRIRRLPLSVENVQRALRKG